MKRTLIGSGRLSKRKPRVNGLEFIRRKSRAKKRRLGIWYIVYPDGSRQSTRQRLATQAEQAAELRQYKAGQLYMDVASQSPFTQELLPL